jgi:hypothetical protein
MSGHPLPPPSPTLQKDFIYLEQEDVKNIVIKTLSDIIGWQSGSSGRVPSWQACSPEFKSKLPPKKPKTKKKKKTQTNKQQPPPKLYLACN